MKFSEKKNWFEIHPRAASDVTLYPLEYASVRVRAWPIIGGRLQVKVNGLLAVHMTNTPYRRSWRPVTRSPSSGQRITKYSSSQLR